MKNSKTLYHPTKGIQQVAQPMGNGVYQFSDGTRVKKNWMGTWKEV